MVRQGNEIAARCALLILMAVSLGVHYVVTCCNKHAGEPYRPMKTLKQITSKVEQPYSSVVLSFPYLHHLITCPYTAASICYQDLCPASIQPLLYFLLHMCR